MPPSPLTGFIHPTPSLAYPHDMPLTGLCTAELLLVTTLRLFARSCDGPAERAWQPGFEAAGIAPCAVRAFDTLFNIVARLRHRSLDVRCPHCRHLGVDEGRLLQFISLMQRSRAREAFGVLAEWLPPCGMRLAVFPAQKLADALMQGGLFVPHRLGWANEPCRAASPAPIGSASIHPE